MYKVVYNLAVIFVCLDCQRCNPSLVQKDSLEDTWLLKKDSKALGRQVKTLPFCAQLNVLAFSVTT